MSNSIKRATTQQPLEERIKELKALRTSIYNKMNQTTKESENKTFSKIDSITNNQNRKHSR